MDNLPKLVNGGDSNPGLSDFTAQAVIWCHGRQILERKEEKPLQNTDQVKLGFLKAEPWIRIQSNPYIKEVLKNKLAREEKTHPKL